MKLVKGSCNPYTLKTNWVHAIAAWPKHTFDIVERDNFLSHPDEIVSHATLLSRGHVLPLPMSANVTTLKVL